MGRKQKKKELEEIDATIQHGYEIVKDEPDYEVKRFGITGLNELAPQVSRMQNELHFPKYYIKRRPTVAEVETLRKGTDETLSQVETKSQEAKRRAAAEASRRAAAAQPRHILTSEELRRLSINLPERNPPAAQGAPSPAASTISLNSARFQRSQTPAVILEGLTPPPRHPYDSQTGVSASSSSYYNYHFDARNAAVPNHYPPHAGHRRNETMSTQWSDQSLIQEEHEGSQEE